MDPVPYFILGTMFGSGSILITQYYGRRKVKQAVGSVSEPNRAVALLADENERQMGMISRLEERIAVMERIATDPAERTHREIELLR
jgi:hypothetical protein